MIGKRNKLIQQIYCASKSFKFYPSLPQAQQVSLLLHQGLLQLPHILLLLLQHLALLECRLHQLLHRLQLHAQLLLHPCLELHPKLLIVFYLFRLRIY